MPAVTCTFTIPRGAVSVHGGMCAWVGEPGGQGARTGAFERTGAVPCFHPLAHAVPAALQVGAATDPAGCVCRACTALGAPVRLWQGTGVPCAASAWVLHSGGLQRALRQRKTALLLAGHGRRTSSSRCSSNTTGLLAVSYGAVVEEQSQEGLALYVGVAPQVVSRRQNVSSCPVSPAWG